MNDALIDESLALGETVNLFLDSMVGGKWKAKTIRWYGFMLSPLVAYLDMPLASVTIWELRKYRASLVGEMEASTLHAHVRACRRFFNWCVEEGLLSSSPAARLELPGKVIHPRSGISDKDLAKIRVAASSVRDRLILAFLWESWCRADGLIGLDVSSLDLERCSAQVTEKFGKSRAVYFSPSTADLLREYVGDREGPVFLSETTGNPLTYWGLYELLDRLRQKAGVKSRWSPHQFRHGAIRSFLQQKAGSLGIASQLAGHADIKVTHEFYGTFADSELQEFHTRWLEKNEITS